MKLSNIKINGIKNPVGFALDSIYVSWIVEEAVSKRQVKAKIEIAKDASFSELVFVKEGTDISCHETSIEMKPEPCQTYYCRVHVWGDAEEYAVSEVAYFETAKADNTWVGEWIGAPEEEQAPIILKKRFFMEHPVSDVRLYICGLGLYEAYVDGIKIGDEFLAPYCNDYRYQLQYQTYEIPALKKGEHELAIMLGSGWYMGRFGLNAKAYRYGNRRAAIAELHLTYQQKKCVIATDETWEYTKSPIIKDGIYDGECIDASLWEDYQKCWKPAEKVVLPKENLVPRYSLPVRLKETRKPVEVIVTPGGDTVLDMGQNMVGFLSFTSDFPKGTCIHLEFGEVMQNGEFYNDNYRSAVGGFSYTASGNYEEVRAHFTYFGFRYVRVSGWQGLPEAEAFTANVLYSDLERTGFMETANPKIDRLYENCLWSQKSNFIDMPTDCPQRDERLGWTGDAQVFTSTASYNMDTRSFYRKFLTDLHIEQKRLDGAVPNFIPNLDNEKDVSSVWGDAAAFMPAYLYRMYANRTELRKDYPMMKQWVDYITALTKEAQTGDLFLPGFCFGDWLAQDGITPDSFKGGTDDGYISSMYYYQSAYYTAWAAEILGIKEDVVFYKQLAERIKKAVLDEYFSKNGRLAVDTQAAYIIALKFGVYVNEEKLIEQLKQRFAKDCYRLKCGFVGAPLLCTTLAEHGMADLAYDFLLKEEFPGWLYCVNLGATTIWERWNSLGEDGTVSPTGMNSFNHYAYGSVVEFLYAYVAGIRPYTEGFAEAIIQPVIDIRLPKVKCSYMSAWGSYQVDWEVEKDGMVRVHLKIPFDCRAHVYLPQFTEKEMLLEAGSYDYYYKPQRDFRKCFDASTRLGQLAGNERAMRILKKKLPICYGMVMGKDEENLTKSLEEFCYMGFMGISPEAVKEAIEEISQIIVSP